MSGTRVAALPISARPRAAVAGLSEYRTFTDGRGTFSFPQLAAGEYVVRSEPTELYESASAVLRAGTDAVLVVERKSDEWIEIRGVVESAGGGALAGVLVDAIGQRTQAAVSDAGGGYTLRLGATSRLQNVALRFRREGYRERHLSVGNAVRLSDHELLADVRLDPLSALAPVSGVVTADDGNPVQGATVLLDSADRGQAHRGVTDTAGRFRFAAVEEGSDYVLWVRPRATYKDERRENVRVSANGTRLSVVLHSLGVASLRGTMVDPRGVPIPGFTLWLTAAYGAAARSLQVTSDAQGRFSIDNVPEGPAVLETRAGPRIAVSGIQLTAAAAQDVTVPIDVGSDRLQGRVVSATGTPVAGAALSLQWSSEGTGVTSRSSRDTISDEEGYFAFAQLGPGGHALTVAARGYATASVRQNVGAGQPPVEVRLRRNAGITDTPR